MRPHDDDRLRCRTKGKPELASSLSGSGTVTYQAKPVEGAEVTFSSTTKNSVATGKTDANGRFVLSTHTQNDGAVSGEHMVTIRRVDIVDNTPPGVDLSAGGKAVPPTITWIVPEKFSKAGKSGLSASVSETGTNDFKFDLK